MDLVSGRRHARAANAYAPAHRDSARLGSGNAESVMARKYSEASSKKVEKTMKEMKAGTLRSGRSGKKVKSRKQAIAIGLSEARRAGKKVPKKATR
jgi:hypothetical protein